MWKQWEKRPNGKRVRGVTTTSRSSGATDNANVRSVTFNVQCSSSVPWKGRDLSLAGINAYDEVDRPRLDYRGKDREEGQSGKAQTDGVMCNNARPNPPYRAISYRGFWELLHKRGLPGSIF